MIRQATFSTEFFARQRDEHHQLQSEVRAVISGPDFGYVTAARCALVSSVIVAKEQGKSEGEVNVGVGTPGYAFHWCLDDVMQLMRRVGFTLGVE